VTVESAYRACEEITRANALNFFYGIRLLPPDKRRAMCAVYAFARRVDDIGDGDLARDVKLRLLADARAGVASRPTSTRRSTRRSTSSSATAARSPGRSGASRWRSSAAATARPPTRSPTISAWRCS
jgi:15-cis-phytoene synthase